MSIFTDQPPKAQLKLLLAIPFDEPVPVDVTPEQLLTMAAGLSDVAINSWQGAIDRGLKSGLLAATATVEAVMASGPVLRYTLARPSGGRAVAFVKRPKPTESSRTVTMVSPKAVRDWLTHLEMEAPPAMATWLACCEELLMRNRDESVEERNRRWARRADDIERVKGTRHGARKAAAELIAKEERVQMETVERAISEVRRDRSALNGRREDGITNDPFAGMVGALAG